MNQCERAMITSRQMKLTENEKKKNPSSAVALLSVVVIIILPYHRCMQSYCIDVGRNAGVHIWICVSPGCS